LESPWKRHKIPRTTAAAEPPFAPFPPGKQVRQGWHSVTNSSTEVLLSGQLGANASVQGVSPVEALKTNRGRSIELNVVFFIPHLHSTHRLCDKRSDKLTCPLSIWRVCRVPPSHIQSTSTFNPIDSNTQPRHAIHRHVSRLIINLGCSSLRARKVREDNSKHVLAFALLARIPSLPTRSKFPIVRPKYSSCTSSQTKQSRGQPSKYTCREPTLASSTTPKSRSFRHLRH
jgi:hypothetical protein